MNQVVLIALLGWAPLGIALFPWLGSVRAAAWGLILPWLFLPVAGFAIPGLPDYSKASAPVLAILLGTSLFDPKRITGFRPAWLDIPTIVWCLCPIPTSLLNNFGLYDGVSSSLNQAVNWGFPYLIGRIYFHNITGLRLVVIAIFIGGLIYIPFCLYEIRMSPQLSMNLYGVRIDGFAHTKRFGGWRPIVFMQTGLMVGLWMAFASLYGLWLWASGAAKRFGAISTFYPAVLLTVTTILCKSTGAIVLLAIGAIWLFLTSTLRTSTLTLVMLLVPLAYVLLRIAGFASGDTLVEWVKVSINDERAQSLAFRFREENLLITRALQKPVFGHGGWGNYRVNEDLGDGVTRAADSLWIQTFGSKGLLGLASLLAVTTVPCAIVWRRLPPHLWRSPPYAPLAATVVVMGLYSIDNLVNAMEIPVFWATLGGLASNSMTLPTNRAFDSQIV